ncbi:hypothetical protein [Litorisediminicola beolgyonensis]|uniref:Glycerophosphoryl diester phosphodiesterase membrane domain-containing protein n=1 Tax=Litorisediminicola beolgyonensis TaxID=1173614 RepID=A0ABW3ZLP1_9RHOB
MLGWEIFRHAVRMVFRNFHDALRVSAVLYLVQVAASLWVETAMPKGARDGDAFEMIPVGSLTTALFLGVAAVISSLWIAVAWHRFVLAEEYPSGWLPRWHGDRMFAYFGWGIAISLIVLFGAVLMTIPVSVLVMLMPPLAIFMPFAFTFFAAWFGFRLSIKLPAVAMGNPLKLSEVWERTSGSTGTFLVLALCTLGAIVAVSVIPAVLGTAAPSLAFALGAIANWVVTMVGISILTTLYGVYIEGRRLG